MIIGHIFNIFLPKNANPVISHKDIIVDPLGLTPTKTKRNRESMLVKAEFRSDAPTPPIST